MTTAPHVRLIVADLAILDAAIEGDEALSRALGGSDVAQGWSVFPEALPATRAALAADPDSAQWGTRFFVAGDPPQLAGWGGFKGAPADGVVELGYEIAEGLRGRGLATAAVEEMLREAFAAPEVNAVIAHTLPEHNASTRVLEKAGFTRSGEAQDADVGTIWRWRRER
jgi:[ribosomal protein S5]-alanine N-acetyltransferase